MDFIGAWLLVPLVLALLSLGLGLLVDRLAGRRLPGVLLAPVGLAALIVVADLATRTDATAELAVPLAVLGALLGYGLDLQRLRAVRRPDLWALVAAGATYLAILAPVVGAGSATFTGYTVLDDTSTHLVLLDHIATEGRTIPQSVETTTDGTVKGYLETEYPVGAQMTVLIAAKTTATDLAWAYVPAIGFMLATMALALFSLAGRLTQSGWQRALLAAIPAQAGLLYAYALQGSIKEIGTVWALSLTVALISLALGSRISARALVPLAVTVAAALAILSLAIVPWLGVPLAALAVAALLQAGRDGWKRVALALAGAGALAALLALPTIVGARMFFDVARAVLGQAADLGNLARPLELQQVLGVWPSGDYRIELVANETLAEVLMVVVAVSALLGVVWLALRARTALGPAIFVGGSVVAAVYLLRSGSPYADGKTLAVASPAVAFAALGGATWLWGTKARVLGALVALVVVGGTLWTNAQAYHHVALAPRDRFEELERIGELVEGDGPTLFNEYEQFANYFLRDAEPVNVPGSSFRYRTPQLEAAFGSGKETRDLDQLDPSFVREFPYVALRRSPFASRPGSGYEQVWAGEHYELWKRRPDAPRVLAHSSSPDVFAQRQRTSCRELARLAAQAREADGSLAYAERPQLQVVLPGDVRDKPAGWGLAPADPTALFVSGPGDAAWTVDVPRAGVWRAWIAAPLGRGFELTIDRHEVGHASYALGNAGQYVPVGSARLGPGKHELVLSRSGGDLRAGNGRGDSPLGRIVLEAIDGAAARDRVEAIAPDDYRRLCGRSLDWVEAVEGPVRFARR